jgi:hypothetical protein
MMGAFIDAAFPKRLPKSCRATPRFLLRSSAGWPSICSIGTNALARRCCWTPCAARCNPDLLLPSWSSILRTSKPLASIIVTAFSISDRDEGGSICL